jgi:hypothetical protein
VKIVIRRGSRFTGSRKPHGAHQPAIGVIQDVAVKHPGSRTIVISHDNLQTAFVRHAHRVFPFERSNRLARFVQHLKEEPVQMERM